VPGGDELLDDDAALALATELEGHPDNVAACLRGGATFAWGDPVRVLRLDAHPDLAAVAFVPTTRSSTHTVRGMLPATIPFADAAHNAGRAALLPIAVSSAPELLLAATEDRLHQQYRAPAMPETAALVAALRGLGRPAFVSGAGPTVLALVRSADVEAAASEAPAGWSSLSLRVAAQGARLIAPD